MQIKNMLKKLLLILVLCLLFILFISVMFSTSLIFGSKKADLTQTHKYSISPQSLNIAKNLPNPINVTLYISEDLGNEYPELGIHNQYLQRLLNKYQAASNGKISINIKDPLPYSATEYEAKSENIRAFPDTGNTKNLYFGAVFNNSNGEKYTIPYFSVQRQNYTEYDISRILAKLSGYNQNKIGVISFADNISNWQIFKKIKTDYPIEHLSKQSISIPQDIKTLIVYAPQKMDNKLIYAIDQFVLRGGNLILMIDPYAEKIAAKYPYTKNNNINFLPWLKHYGVDMDENKIIGKSIDKSGEYLTFLNNQNQQNIYFDIKDINLPNHMGKALKISMQTAGELNLLSKKDATYTEVLSITEGGGSIDSKIVKFGTKEKISSNFEPDNKKHILAYLIEGNFTSFFSENIYGNITHPDIIPAFLLNSIKPAKIFVISDSDFITDKAWNGVLYLKGSTVYDQIPTNNNADLLLSVIDYMNNNLALSSLHINYLQTEDYSATAQISNTIYKENKDIFLQKWKEINALQKEFIKFQEEYNSQKTTMSLSKIQDYDEYNRKLFKLKEELKALNYKFQQEILQKIHFIIILNSIIFPSILLLCLLIMLKIYRHYKIKKYKRELYE